MCVKREGSDPCALGQRQLAADEQRRIPGDQAQPIDREPFVGVTHPRRRIDAERVAVPAARERIDECVGTRALWLAQIPCRRERHAKLPVQRCLKIERQR